MATGNETKPILKRRVTLGFYRRGKFGREGSLITGLFYVILQPSEGIERTDPETRSQSVGSRHYYYSGEYPVKTQHLIGPRK